MQRLYVENSKNDLLIFISEVLEEFTSYNFQKIFAKCGYDINGFNPGVAYEKDLNELEFDTKQRDRHLPGCPFHQAFHFHELLGQELFDNRAEHRL